MTAYVSLLTMDGVVIYLFTMESVICLLYNYNKYLRSFHFWVNLVSIGASGE